MAVPTDCKYTETHEWIKINVDGEGTRKMGITEHRALQLGTVSSVTLPAVDTSVTQGQGIGAVTGDKGMAEYHAPCAGAVPDRNDILMDHPDNVSSDPYVTGWIIKLKDANTSQINALMSSSDYEDYLSKL